MIRLYVTPAMMQWAMRRLACVLPCVVSFSGSAFFCQVPNLTNAVAEPKHLRQAEAGGVQSRALREGLQVAQHVEYVGYEGLRVKVMIR